MSHIVYSDCKSTFEADDHVEIIMDEDHDLGNDNHFLIPSPSLKLISFFLLAVKETLEFLKSNVTAIPSKDQLKIEIDEFCNLLVQTNAFQKYDEKGVRAFISHLKSLYKNGLNIIS